MQKFLSSIAFLFLIVAAAIAQEVKPIPKTTPPGDTDVVKISTNLIQIDVTVTDQKGKPISDLKADEIEIFENGEKQKIKNLIFISGSRPVTAKPGPVDKNAIPVPPMTLRPEQIRRTIAIVVDDLSLSFESAYQTRRALKKFVDEQMQEGDLAAIVRTGAGIGALQQFTSDKRMLYAAIEKVKWNPRGSGGISPFAPIDSTLNPIVASGGEEVGGEAAANEGPSLDDFRRSYFAVGTLGALRYVVNGMSELPGRKSVILFSDGFRMFHEDGGHTLDFLRSVVDTANRSSVVFYTVDARGLQWGGLTAADSIPQPSQPGGDEGQSDALTAAAMVRRDQIRDTQEGLNYLAYGTGGMAIKNNNNLSDGVRKVLEDQSYYLVAYEPDSDTFDAAKRKFNKLEVRVTRPGAKTRHRSGFFNVADRERGSTVSKTLTPVGQLQAALLSPFGVNGINLKLNALFGNDPRNGSFVRSLLHIDAADLKFTDEKDGTKRAVFDVLAMSFGDNGQIIDQLAKGYTMTVKPDRYKEILAEGFVYHFAFPVKKPGAYQYRVAIRDFQGGQIGSASQFIEVPNLKKNRLTVSSIVLENLSPDEWRKMENASTTAQPTRPMSDTALRRVRVGSVLRYGFEIYNPKLGASRQPGLRFKIRIFRDGSLILDGTQNSAELTGQTDMQRVKAAGAIALGKKMLSGDYILQVIVTDELAKAKQQVATQFVQFEIVE